jgi:hypothetical protein
MVEHFLADRQTEREQSRKYMGTVLNGDRRDNAAVKLFQTKLGIWILPIKRNSP